MAGPAPKLRLVSHHLCPYVQRAVIALSEKGVAHERTYIDLTDKPAWFTAVSPLGKVPILLVGEDSSGTVLFESAVICEFLEETAPGARLHPADPVERARHRAWVEFASAALNSIAGLYAAPDAAAFEQKRADLAGKVAWLERALGAGPYFAGEQFSLADAAFGPVFRYFDTFEATLPPLGVLDGAQGARVASRPRRPAERTGRGRARLPGAAGRLPAGARVTPVASDGMTLGRAGECNESISNSRRRSASSD